MTDTAKPPMVVWLDRYACSVQCLGFYAPKKESLHVNAKGGTKTFGPYVHLDQFMAEVERRADEMDGNGGAFEPCQAEWLAVLGLTKELKEQ